MAESAGVNQQTWLGLIALIHYTGTVQVFILSIGLLKTKIRLAYIR